MYLMSVYAHANPACIPLPDISAVFLGGRGNYIGREIDTALLRTLSLPFCLFLLISVLFLIVLMRARELPTMVCASLR